MIRTAGGLMQSIGGLGVPVEGRFPGSAWVPVGPIVTTAKLTAAGATTRHQEGAYINTTTPTVFRKPAWWTGNPAFGKWVLLFGGHYGRNVVAASSSDLADPDSWTIHGTVLSFEEAIDLAADLVPDGVIDPPPTVPAEQIGSASVWVDHDGQRLLVLMRVGVSSGVPRTNLAGNTAVGFITTDLDAWTIVGGVGASKNLGYATFAQWASPPGSRVGHYCPVVTRLGTTTENGRLERGWQADWFKVGSSTIWPTLDPANVAGLGGDISQRHLCAYWESPTRLRVYWSARGASPERIESVLIDAVDADTAQWRVIAGSHRDERSPLLAWEGAGLGGVPSPPAGSAATEPVQQLRDPFVFDDGATKWMVCAVRGEYDIGLYRWGTP